MADEEPAMMSRFDMVRRWLLNLLAWSALLIGAGALGARLPIALAIPAWVAAAGVLCAAGALLIKSQPPGKPTMGGRTGYLVTHFGFRAGQGRLASAAAISWGVWTVVGVGVVWTASEGWRPLVAAMAAAWVIDVLAIFYLVGIALRDRPRGDAGERSGLRLPPTVIKLSGAAVALLAVSGVLWWLVGTPSARLGAVAVAGGPLVVAGAGFGLFMLVLMTVGRNVRWN